MQATGSTAFDDFSDLVLGRALPAGAEALIAHAGANWHHPEVAQASLEAARAMAPDHPATLIALYRFHFYGNRLPQTRVVACDAIALAARALGIAQDWRQVSEAQWREQTTALGGGFEPLPRFWLFSLKGYAYLCMRLGDLDEGARALAVLTRLDPENRVGHRVLEDVLARIGHEDDDYLDDPSPQENAA